MRLLPALMVSILIAPLAAAQPQLVLQQIASGLSRPVEIRHAGDSRLFILQQTGQIVIHDGSRVLPTPFLDIRPVISGGVQGQSERGLLGLAFHPRFAQNGFFFVHYTATNGDVVIARYSVSITSSDRADANSGTIVLRIPHSQFSNHNGGQLQFGSDGFLYIGVGDGGSGGDPNNNGQNSGTLLGKILRIDVDSVNRVPSSNPFGNEIWAYGLRNPWRFSFDRVTQDLWIGDVGQNAWEEIDFQPATSIGGENYGWRVMEGRHCFPSGTNCQQPGMVLPVLEYPHAGGACSVTGGYVYRGARYPRMSGMYFYADYCTGAIWGATKQSDGTWSSQLLLSTRLSISSFGEDQNGELYVADLDGFVYRLTDNLPAQPRRRAVKK